MKLFATLTVIVICLQAVLGFQPISTASVSRMQLMAKPVDGTASNANVAPFDPITRKLMPSIAATTGVLLSMGIDPAFAAKEDPPDMSYVGKDFTAQFLPAIMVPLVGLVFPAFSMALFFLYVQQDDAEAA